MVFEFLEQAILKNDRQLVMSVLSSWNEDERREANAAFESFCRAAGGFNTGRIDVDDLTWEEREKREHICDCCGVEHVDAARSRLYDVLELAYVGLSDHGYLPMELIAYPERAREFAQLWIARNPPWFDDWYAKLISNIAWGLDPVMWVCFFHAKRVPAPEDPSAVLERLVERFPKAFATCPDESQWTLRELPSLRHAVLRVCDISPSLAGNWATAVEWLSRNGLMDRPAALQNALRVLKKTKKGADRRSLMRFIRAMDATALELSSVQEELCELLSDKLLDLAGNAAVELAKVANSKGFQSDRALESIHRVFQHKTKLYAKGALTILQSFAANPQYSAKAMLATIAALDHADVSIQRDAINLLKEYLHSSHREALALLEESKDRLAVHLGSDILELIEAMRGAGSTKLKESM